MGCKTAQPHEDDPIVQGLIAEYSNSERMAQWVLSVMAELRQSIFQDIENKRILAWFSRLRQPEELYIRTLYALFVATDKELHHILSGDRPNGFSLYYPKVNALVYGGRGELQEEKAGLRSGTFKPMDTLNDGAHVNFRAFFTCMGLLRNPEFMPPEKFERYKESLNRYCNYLNEMRGLFEQGRTKEQVLAAVISLHRPKSYWQEKAGQQ